MSETPKNRFFDGIVFQPDFRAAHRSDGRRIGFTTFGSRTLARLVAHPHRVLTRAQVLDAVSGPGSARLDRDVDYGINRLRAKLEDDARSPRFIATRYGEGYLWIAQPVPDDARTAAAQIVIGPWLGPEADSGAGQTVRRLAETLAARLRRRLRGPVAVALSADAVRLPDAAAPDCAVEIVLLDEGGATDCVLTLREFATGRRLGGIRTTLPVGPETPDRVGESLAGRIVGILWRGRALGRAAEAPLGIGAHAAAAELTGLTGDWRELRRRSAVLLAESPDCPTAMLLAASALHAEMIARGPQGFVNGSGQSATRRTRIGALARRALAGLDDAPMLRSQAAALLRFAVPDAALEAVAMAEDAHALADAPAATLGVVATRRAHEGRLDAAHAAIDRALALALPGSASETFLLVLRCKTLLLAGCDDALGASFEALRLRRPPGWPMLALAIGGEVPDPPAAWPARVGPRATLQYLHFVLARPLRRPEHAWAVLRPAALELSGRHSAAVLDALPAPVRALAMRSRRA